MSTSTMGLEALVHNAMQNHIVGLFPVAHATILVIPTFVAPTGISSASITISIIHIILHCTKNSEHFKLNIILCDHISHLLVSAS